MQKRRYLQVLLILLFAIGLMGLLWTSALHIALPVDQTRERPIIGDLGGVPVEVPRAYARFVEYDGDPHFMERKENVPVKRTYKSRLRSFGFDVRFSDMAVKERNYSGGSRPLPHRWINVSVKSGDRYDLDGKELNRLRDRILQKNKPCHDKCFFYIEMPQKKYGLTGYEPIGSGVNVGARNIDYGRGADLRDRNIYYYEDPEGRVVTYIRCSNRSHGRATCTQHFDLCPRMRVRVTVLYHRDEFLEKWKEIQRKVSRLIYGFAVRENEVKEGYHG